MGRGYAARVDAGAVIGPNPTATVPGEHSYPPLMAEASVRWSAVAVMVGSGRVRLAGDESRFVPTIQSAYDKLCLGVPSDTTDFCEEVASVERVA